MADTSFADLDPCIAHADKSKIYADILTKLEKSREIATTQMTQMTQMTHRTPEEDEQRRMLKIASNYLFGVDANP